MSDNVEHAEIWRDEATGLPMHSHHQYKYDATTNAFLTLEQGFIPCDCKCRAFDIPLNAIKAQSEALEDNNERTY